MPNNVIQLPYTAQEILDILARPSFVPSTASVTLESDFATESPIHKNYVVPEDGWFCVSGMSTHSTGWIYAGSNTSTGIRSQCHNTADNGVNVCIPVSKNDSVYVSFFHVKNVSVIFTYAKGKEPVSN